MITEVEYNVIVVALRTLFLIAVPLVFILALTGTITAVFQAATNVQESAISYFAKLIALIAVSYFLLPGVIDSLVQLFQLALSS